TRKLLESSTPPLLTGLQHSQHHVHGGRVLPHSDNGGLAELTHNTTQRQQRRHITRASTKINTGTQGKTECWDFVYLRPKGTEAA
ncbi:hypothetical protein BaRGS_00014160, partial [Batillaria attramentaria]